MRTLSFNRVRETLNKSRNDEKEHRSYFTVTIEGLKEIVNSYYGTGTVLVKKADK